MEGNGEGHGAREPARGITHACYLTPKRYRYPCVLRNARLSIRALSAFAIVRVASFRAVLAAGCWKKIEFQIFLSRTVSSPCIQIQN